VLTVKNKKNPRTCRLDTVFLCAALAKYTVRVADGKVFVQADSEALAAGRAPSFGPFISRPLFSRACAAGRRAPTVKKAGSARDKRTFVILVSRPSNNIVTEQKK